MRKKLLRYLAMREHSRLELKQKLLAKGFAEKEIDTELDALEKNNLQSDARFAHWYVRMRQDAGFGPMLITEELKSRGVSDNLIMEAIRDPEKNWSTLLRDVHRKKFSIKPVEIEKQYCFLLRRGFEMEMISEVIERR